MKRNWIAILMVLSAILCIVSGCGGNEVLINATEPPSTSNPPKQSDILAPSTPIPENDTIETLAAKTRLLAVWSDLLSVKDTLYGTQSWVYGYIDEYLESHDWNDLSRARTACITAVRSLRELEKAAEALEDLNDEEYEALYQAGVDAEYQSQEIMKSAYDVQDAISAMRDGYMVDLESYVPFSNTELSILSDELSLSRQELGYFLECDCLMTNYLLLSLNCPDAAGTFWDEMPSKYPSLCVGRNDWISDSAFIEQQMQECLDCIEALETPRNRILSRQKDALDRMTEIFKTRNFAELAADACDLQNLPLMLPEPDWYDPDSTKYLSFISGGDGTVTYPEAGSMLEDQPYSTYLQIENIARGDIEEYLETAAFYAVDSYRAGDTASWVIDMGDYQVSMDMDGETATILFMNQDITFAPFWFIGD